MNRLRSVLHLTIVLALAHCLGLGAALAEDGPVRFDGHSVVRVHLQTEDDLRFMLGVSDDPWAERLGVGVLDFRVAPDRMDDLRASGLEFEVLIEDVQSLIDDERERLNTRHLRAWFDDYRTNAEVSDYVDTLVNDFPHIATRHHVGTSIQGREIYAIRITGSGDDSGRRALLYTGGQHAREWVSISTSMYIADRFVRDYGVDPRTTDLLDATIVYIIPVVNPDGYEFTWTTQRLWRKNRRNNPGSSFFGVDLNRNWGYEWGGQGSSGATWSDIYRGAAPFSEPETAAVRDFTLARDNIAAHVDIHSYSQLVLSPWGYTQTDVAPDACHLDGLAQEMADEIFSVHQKPYFAGPAGASLYVASGIGPDWFYGERNIYAWTFELRDTGQFGFILPATEIVPTGEETLAAVLHLGESVAYADRVRFEGPDGPGESVAPSVNAPVSFDARAILGATLDDSTVTLHARVDGGAYVGATMLETSPGVFAGTLPAGACGQVIEYFVTAATTMGDTASFPADAPVNVFTLPVLDPDGPCLIPGDANGDGVVDFADLNIVLNQFGLTGAPGELQGDLNGDGAVGFADLNIVLSNFGAGG